MKAKKAALVYNWTLTFMVIFILSYALMQFNSKYNKYKFVGEKQLGLFKIYQKAESSLFYIDQSAKYALQQAVYELAKNGGDEISENKCGKFYGYAVWYELKKDGSGKHEIVPCFDKSNAKTGLEHFFNKDINEYLLAYPHKIPQDNYDYEIISEKGSLELIGKAKLPLKFDILKDGK